MSWFRELVGFDEGSYDETRRRLEVVDATLRSKVNGRTWSVGRLETPTLAELRTRARVVAGTVAGRLRVSCIRADVRDLHRDLASTNALFQVASQFNLLEMISPEVSPEDGVARYAMDPTQGPACAMSAGAATIYRNYFAPVDGEPGQTRRRQIDCLRDIGAALGNENAALWTMRNGYALCTTFGLEHIRRRLGGPDSPERESVRDLLRIGIHWDVEVTSARTGHTVSQVFCSALPVSYSPIPAREWEPFARVILEGAYEATLLAAALNMRRSSSPVVYLTQLGGGAFGNESAWILQAMRRALRLVRDLALDVRIVSHAEPKAELKELVREFG